MLLKVIFLRIAASASDGRSAKGCTELNRESGGGDTTQGSVKSTNGPAGPGGRRR